MYGNIENTDNEARLIKERTEANMRLAAVLKACGGTVKVKRGDLQRIQEYKIDTTFDSASGEVTFRLDNGHFEDPKFAAPAIPADEAAAQDVRNAVAALNEAIIKAKGFGLRVDVEQVAFNPRKVVVKIWKNL